MRCNVSDFLLMPTRPPTSMPLLYHLRVLPVCVFWDGTWPYHHRVQISPSDVAPRDFELNLIIRRTSG